MRISAEKVDVSCILRLEKESFLVFGFSKRTGILFWVHHRTEMWLHRGINSTKSMPSYQVCLGL